MQKRLKVYSNEEEELLQSYTTNDLVIGDFYEVWYEQKPFQIEKIIGKYLNKSVLYKQEYFAFTECLGFTFFVENTEIIKKTNNNYNNNPISVKINKENISFIRKVNKDSPKETIFLEEKFEIDKKIKILYEQNNIEIGKKLKMNENLKNIYFEEAEKELNIFLNLYKKINPFFLIEEKYILKPVAEEKNIFLQKQQNLKLAEEVKANLPNHLERTISDDGRGNKENNIFIPLTQKYENENIFFENPENRVLKYENQTIGININTKGFELKDIEKILKNYEVILNEENYLIEAENINNIFKIPIFEKLLTSCVFYLNEYNITSLNLQETKNKIIPYLDLTFFGLKDLVVNLKLFFEKIKYKKIIKFKEEKKDTFIHIKSLITEPDAFSERFLHEKTPRGYFKNFMSNDEYFGRSMFNKVSLQQEEDFIEYSKQFYESINFYLRMKYKGLNDEEIINNEDFKKQIKRKIGRPVSLSTIKDIIKQMDEAYYFSPRNFENNLILYRISGENSEGKPYLGFQPSYLSTTFGSIDEIEDFFKGDQYIINLAKGTPYLPIDIFSASSEKEILLPRGLYLDLVKETKENEKRKFYVNAYLKPYDPNNPDIIKMQDAGLLDYMKFDKCTEKTIVTIEEENDDTLLIKRKREGGKRKTKKKKKNKQKKSRRK